MQDCWSMSQFACKRLRKHSAGNVSLLMARQLASIGNGLALLIHKIRVCLNIQCRICGIICYIIHLCSYGDKYEASFSALWLRARQLCEVYALKKQGRPKNSEILPRLEPAEHGSYLISYTQYIYIYTFPISYILISYTQYRKQYKIHNKQKGIE